MLGGKKEQKSAASSLCTHPLLTPLLPAPTLNAGECRVSGGQLKVSGRPEPGLNHALVARSPKWPTSIFGGLLKAPVVVAMVEPPVSYLASTVPCRCLRGGHLSWFCRPCLFYSGPTLLNLPITQVPSPPSYEGNPRCLLRTTELIKPSLI